MRAFMLVAVAFFASACGQGEKTTPVSQSERPQILPQQFALVPCQTVTYAKAPPCVLLAAGGKYFLFGAPENAVAMLRDEEMRLLDGVLLFSLLPQHIDGLDTIRHLSWKKGRSQALLVVGPDGTGAFAQAIDSAFEIPDAEYFTRESPPGGFDASLLRPVEIGFDSASKTEVVDTGDLQIAGMPAPSGQMIYQVQYGGRRAALGMCGSDEDEAALAELSEGDHVYSCNDNSDIVYIIK